MDVRSRSIFPRRAPDTFGAAKVSEWVIYFEKEYDITSPGIIHPRIETLKTEYAGLKVQHTPTRAVFEKRQPFSHAPKCRKKQLKNIAQMVMELIESITISEATKETGKRTQEITIQYRFIGNLLTDAKEDIA